MGLIKKPVPVKLFVGMISAQDKLFDKASRLLEKKFSKIDLKSSVITFDFTAYYEKEIGENLLRQFISFEKLIDPGILASVKILTNKTEEKFCRKDDSRRINLDPGYITESNLILATTKGFQHRIYLGKGIFGEVTLRYQKGSFSPYEWTYPDYRTDKYIDFFMQVRTNYRKQLQLWKGQKNTGG